MHIKVRKHRGLDLPLEGAPTGEVQPVLAPSHIALHVGRFDDVKFKVLVKVGDSIRLGQPVLLDKTHPERHFVAPAGGTLREIRRGLKRRLLSLVIEREDPEPVYQRDSFDLRSASREQLVAHMCESGLFAHLRMRPFNLLAIPSDVPRNIFVKCVESAPFVPPAELQVQGLEQEFQVGLDALAKLTSGAVHLVHHQHSQTTAFTQARGVTIHTVSGPHPCANHSLHIHRINPITRPDQRTWTLNAHDVVCIGKMLRTGQMHVHRVIAIAGPGILPKKRGYYRVRTGFPIAPLLVDRNTSGKLRLISGDPLMGSKTEGEEFMAADHFVFTALHEPRKRQFLHFLRLGLRKYSVHRAYLSGQLSGHREYDMTTNLHGEERAFIDGAVYERVMPMNIPTALLIKAILSEDYDHAEMVGVLEVDAEDFALPAFMCPSKIEMVQIVRKGLRAFAAELLT